MRKFYTAKTIEQISNIVEMPIEKIKEILNIN